MESRQKTLKGGNKNTIREADMDQGNRCTISKEMKNICLFNSTRFWGGGENSPDIDKFTEAIIKFITNKALRESMGEEARESVVERFSMNKIIRQWEELLP
ncbi:hypothetical protein MNBD_BACTEROID01-1661 [hydrothermal vent metagenome]|uniref:Uncharacterized protein n=1 Tax=hydrothermal vent metagenome TaxID=652676 RepID=A0A3B0TNV4_9ZZZZ